MAVFNEEFLSEREFEAVLATFSCYDNGFYVSEVVKRTATDQKDYHKCNSFCSFIHSFIHSSRIHSDKQFECMGVQSFLIKY